MTFYELYQQYLNKYTAPQQGIMSIQPVTPVGESRGDGGDQTTQMSNYSDRFMGNPQAKSISFSHWTKN